LWGAFFAVIGASLTPFFIILVIATFFTDFADLPAFKGFFDGARVGVTVILANLSFQLLRKSLKRYFVLMVIAAGTVGIVFFNISSIWILLLCSILIYIIDRRQAK
ncbi:MAG: chromate transporter, partial [Kosmotogaceae bacterium]